jgi:hypothetical protein
VLFALIQGKEKLFNIKRKILAKTFFRILYLDEIHLILCLLLEKYKTFFLSLSLPFPVHTAWHSCYFHRPSLFVCLGQERKRVSKKVFIHIFILPRLKLKRGEKLLIYKSLKRRQRMGREGKNQHEEILRVNIRAMHV